MHLETKKLFALLIVILLSRGILAEDTKLVLLDGTPIRLRTTENLSSQDAVKGGTVSFELMEDIYVNDVLVAKKGSVAIGTITEAQHKRNMGRQGRMAIALDYMRLLNGEKAQLRGTKAGSGGGHTGAMVGAMVVTSLVIWPAAPLFLFMHGKDINIPKGTPIVAYVDGDFTIGPARVKKTTVLQSAESADTAATSLTAPSPARTGDTAPGSPPAGRLCLSSMIDAQGNETCTRYAKQ
ncbi:MAG TPA: PEGA domain-containing protein [Terriglobales bacterium]|jgi:hypothetical protein|nr:PEGA domain-containing protein [Terriglobales bacterium]